MKFYIENKEDFALMLKYREQISYEQAIDLCYFIEEIYETYRYRASLEYMVKLLLNIIKVCIKFIKYHKMENDKKPSPRLVGFYDKLLRAKFEILPMVVENYSKFLVC